MPPLRTCLYYSNWSIYQKDHFVEDIPIHLVSNIFYAFIGINADSGVVELTDPWADVDKPMNDGSKGCIGLLAKLKERSPNLKVSMSIGGWGKEHLFKSIACSPAKLNNFVNSSLDMCKKYGFDGIDIDWEYPKDSSEANQLLEILRKVREASGPDFLLTIAAPAGGENINVLPIAEMNKYLSFWNIMCYDYNGSWSSHTGYHSNLFGTNNGDNSLNCHDVIQTYISKGVPPSNLILGMPNYGRTFQCERPAIGIPFSGNPGSSGEPGSWIYKLLPIGNEWVDEKMVSAYCYDSNQKILVVYDNPNTIRMKADYIKLHKLGGGMFWESNGDNYENKERCLLENFTDQLRK